MQSEKKIKIRLEPLGRQVEVASQTTLKDVLFEYGVEFPCGGRGTCRKCRIKILEGNLAVNKVQRKTLTRSEIGQGWRLACQCQVTEPIVIELAQMEIPVLADSAKIEATGESGLAAVVDLGTTTLVAQMLDLKTGVVLGMETALNSQARHGADIMSRIQYGLTTNGKDILQNLIRNQIGQMLTDLIRKCKCPERRLKQVNIVGNSVMHHLFGGLSLDSLAVLPFKIEQPGELDWQATEIGWQLPGNPSVKFLPCLGGFVGSDILAGILAVGMHHSPEPIALIDLGTNGEVVIGNRDGILCASTAAGPAFEGAQITMGMRATTGAIWKVSSTDNRLLAEVIGNVPARGICGSGLVDVVATALELGWLDATGRITRPDRQISIETAVIVTQADIRELQLAKGAIAAGIRILLNQTHLTTTDINQVFLAGAFGNYINVDSARRIGLLDFPVEIIEQAGNTALHGARLSLLDKQNYRSILSIIKHMPLATDAQFQDIFAENMNFPD